MCEKSPKEVGVLDSGMPFYVEKALRASDPDILGRYNPYPSITDFLFNEFSEEALNEPSLYRAFIDATIFVLTLS